MPICTHGIERFESAIGSYFSAGSSCIKKELWSRITMFVQAILHIIGTVVMQGLRGIGSLILGILTADGKKLQNGCMDLFSVLVQTVALAVLGIVGTIHPRKARELAKQITNHKTFKESTSGCAHTLRLSITGVVRGILGAPIGIVDGITLGISGVLCGQRTQIDTAVEHFVNAFLSPFLGFAVSCSENAKKVVWNQHWMRDNHL